MKFENSAGPHALWPSEPEKNGEGKTTGSVTPNKTPVYFQPKPIPVCRECLKMSKALHKGFWLSVRNSPTKSSNYHLYKTAVSFYSRALSLLHK